MLFQSVFGTTCPNAPGAIAGIVAADCIRHARQTANPFTLLTFMKISNEHFSWPIWPLLVIIVGSFFLPVPSCSPLEQIEDRFWAIGMLLVILRYLWAWKRGGTLVDLIVYAFIGLLMPYISILFVGILSMAVRE